MSGLGFIAFMILMVLKLIDKIDISWTAASAPFWGAIIFDIVMLIVMVGIGAIGYRKL